MKQTSVPLLSALGLALALSLTPACGDDDDDTADAAVDVDADTTPDATATSFCAEFGAPAGTISSVPGSYSGDTAGAGADLQVGSGVCTTELSFYEQAGDDQVVSITGLTAGTDYAVRVTSAADLSLYVATGCTESAGGPAAGECLLFVDEGLSGAEVGSFTAPAGGSVFVVVDQFGTDAAPDASYTLDVFEVECTDNPACTNPDTPICHDFQCVGCVTAFDCDDPAAPACDENNTCVAGLDQCTGDDGNENDDDGPLGANALATPTPGSPTVVTAAICSAPAQEADYYSFSVTEGETRAIVLDWAGTEDLDIVLYDDTGAEVDFALFDQPEVILAEEMTAGDYLVAVTQYSPPGTAAAAAYTLSLSIPECQTSFDCTDPAASFCDPSGTCAEGPTDCVGDDAGEPTDDGPAGAQDVTPAVDNMTTTTAKICNTPATERDFFKVVVNDGDNVDVQVSWEAAGTDLDVVTTLADGTLTGLGYYSSPESISLTNLPAGTHYVQVSYFGTATTTAVEYTITVARTAGGCTTVDDCATVYENQLFRGACQPSGACTFIAGAGALANGATCDSFDDCTSGMCSYAAFESDAEKSVCTVACTMTSECDTALGAGYTCTTPYATNFCTPTCTNNTDCGANVGSDTLDPGLPWDYLTCNAGVCDL